MPVKLLEFLEIIKEILYYQKDNIVIFDEPDLANKGFSIADIRNITHYLFEQKIVVRDERMLVEATAPSPIIAENKRRQFSLLAKIVNSPRKNQAKKYRYIIELVSREKFTDFYENSKPKEILIKKEAKKLEYDSMNGILSHSGKKYWLKDNMRRKLIAILFERRQVKKDGKIIQKGEPWQRESMAIQIGLIESAKDYGSVARNLQDLVNQLNREFRKKDFPIHIDNQGSMQLIEKQ